MFVDGVDYPVDSGVAADGFVGGAVGEEASGGSERITGWIGDG